MSALYSSGPGSMQDLSHFQTYLDRLFRPAEFSSIRALAGQTFPVINVGNTADSVEVMALAPAIAPDKLQLTIDKGLLVIAGERSNDLPAARDGTSIYANERFSGGFRRVISLPEDVDPGKVSANYKDGILRISLAKKESSKPRRIEVN